MQPEESTLAPQITDEVVGVDQPQSSKDAQERKVVREDRRQQERSHDDKVGDRVKLQTLIPTVVRYPEAGCQIRKDHDPEAGIDVAQQRCLRPRDAHDEIDYGQSVEDDQRVAEPLGSLTAAGVEQPDGAVQGLHAIRLYHAPGDWRASSPGRRIQRFWPKSRKRPPCLCRSVIFVNFLG